jgi:hypothetical protein
MLCHEERLKAFLLSNQPGTINFADLNFPINHANYRYSCSLVRSCPRSLNLTSRNRNAKFYSSPIAQNNIKANAKKTLFAILKLSSFTSTQPYMRESKRLKQCKKTIPLIEINKSSVISHLMAL